MLSGKKWNILSTPQENMLTSFQVVTIIPNPKKDGRQKWQTLLVLYDTKKLKHIMYENMK